MIDANELPTNAEDITKLHLEFRRLTDDSPTGCPCSMTRIQDYLQTTLSIAPPALSFCRTAFIHDVRFWVWAFVDTRGRKFFVDVAVRYRNLMLGTGIGEGLSPEQYIGLKFARYWSGRPWRPSPTSLPYIDPMTLPTDDEAIKRLDLDFPRLSNTPLRCPYSMGEIRRYLRKTIPTKRAPNLSFERTALIGNVEFWLWSYIRHGETYLVYVGSRDERKHLSMGCGKGFTAAQFLAINYARHWNQRPLDPTARYSPCWDGEEDPLI